MVDDLVDARVHAFQQQRHRNVRWRSASTCGQFYRKSGVIKLKMAMLHRKVPFEREPTAWDSRTEIRAFGQGLAMTEWLSPEELRSYQAPLVSKLLRHARKTTTFYKDRLAFNLGSRESIDKIWSEIPILTRAEAVQNRLKLISRHKLPRESGPITEGRTSGSTVCRSLSRRTMRPPSPPRRSPSECSVGGRSMGASRSRRSPTTRTTKPRRRTAVPRMGGIRTIQAASSIFSQSRPMLTHT